MEVLTEMFCCYHQIQDFYSKVKEQVLCSFACLQQGLVEGLCCKDLMWRASVY